MIRGKLLIFTLFYILITFGACRKDVNSNSLDYKTLGTSAHKLLSSDQYHTLAVEISYMPGYQPTTASLDELAIFLNTHLDKPGGIYIVPKQIAGISKTQLSLKEVVDLEKSTRTEFTSDNKITVHILITDGYFDENGVLAKAYWNTSFCLFGKHIDERTGGNSIERTRLTTSLLQHEFGHLLGLVNQGSPMLGNHLDTDNGAHCTDASCLMYNELGIDPNSTSAGQIPDLDANCLADLKANGGK